MRDSVSIWVFDDRGEVGLPRIGIEAVAANWEAHGLQVNVAFPDGRVFRLRDDGPAWSAEGPDGRPTVLGAGPLAFRCVEPFRTWTMTFDGSAVADVDVRPRRRARRTARSSTCSSRSRRRWPCRRGSRARSPPTPRGSSRRRSRATSWAAVATSSSSAATGSVQRRRRGAHVHRQRAAHPPPGRPPARRVPGALLAVGAVPERQGVRLHRLPTARRRASRPSTRATSSTATATSIPARVVEAPWLTKLQPLGEDVSVVLETGAGRSTIEGETVLSTYDIHHDDKTSAIEALKRSTPTSRPCSRPACATGGTARRPSGCSSARRR